MLAPPRSRETSIPLIQGAAAAPSVPVGVFWALFTVVVWAGWPVFTRLSVTRALNPEDLVALRYGIGGFILLPVLVHLARRMPPHGWREGVVLAVCQGAPLALLVTVGTKYAPASHMAALSPGLLPLFAAVLSLIFLKESLSPMRAGGLALILTGALVLLGDSVATLSTGFWRGDLLFLCAGFMGSIYTLRMRRSGLTAIQGAALIGVYSMVFYLPFYFALWVGATRLTEAPLKEVAFQAFYQGILMGVVTLFTLSRSIVILGAPRAAAFLSLIPVATAVLGVIVLREVPTVPEAVAVALISIGVLLATEVLRRFGAWKALAA
jgi:drug/metabolite transporter (DMT)-like permease